LQQAEAKGGPKFALLAECRYRLGGLLAQKGDHAGAAAQFEALAGSVAKDHYLLAAAWFGAGEARRDGKDDERALVAFAAAAEAATGERASYRFAALYQLGFTQLRCQQLPAAAATFTAAAGAAPDDAAKGECHYLSGDALLRLREYDAAQKAFARSQKLGGDFADDAAVGLGWVAVGRDDRKAAIAAFEAVLQKYAESPRATEARLELGRALYQNGQAAGAETALQPLLAAGIDAGLQQQAQELLGLCALATGAGDKAVAALQQALLQAKDDDKPRLCYALGEALANLQRWQEAVATYQQVPATAPAALRGDAMYGACFALHALGQHDASLQLASQVLAMTPPHRLAEEARLAAAENRFALQQYEAAEADYTALAKGPHAATAAWKLAWCRYLRGDKKDAAVRFAAIAGAKDPVKDGAHAEEALAMEALSRFEAGEADAALVAADRYRARYQTGAFVERTERVAARVLRQKGDLRGAQQRLQQAAAVAQKRGAEEAHGDALEQAELSYQQGDFQAADAAFAPLCARADAIGARASAGRAWCAFELGDDKGCKAAIAAALQHPAARSERANVLELASALHHRQKDWPAAIAVATEFLRDFGDAPRAPALRYALGTAQARAGEHAAARATLQALADAGGYERMDRVFYELAWACRRGGDEPAALAAFGKVVAGSQDVELLGEARLHLGTAALQQKDLPAAAKLLDAVQGSHRARAQYQLGFAELEAAGDDKQQLAAARDRFLAIASTPGELLGEARFFAAECQARLGQKPQAVATLQQLLRDEPQHARANAAQLHLGEWALHSDQPAVAIQALQQFLAAGEHPAADVARANLWLGTARMRQKDHDGAEACFVVVTEKSDGELAAEAQFRLGENRALRGDLRGAADAFVKLPILYAHPTWVRKGLLQAGRTYEQLGQPDKAQRFYRELQEKHAGSDEAKQAPVARKDG
jgi:tetratricopeptide (TPR) repeat protein